MESLLEIMFSGNRGNRTEYQNKFLKQYFGVGRLANSSLYRIRASKAMAVECAVTRTQIFNFQSFLADDIEQKPKV